MRIIDFVNCIIDEIAEHCDKEYYYHDGNPSSYYILIGIRVFVVLYKEKNSNYKCNCPEKIVTDKEIKIFCVST